MVDGPALGKQPLTCRGLASLAQVEEGARPDPTSWGGKVHDMVEKTWGSPSMDTPVLFPVVVGEKKTVVSGRLLPDLDNVRRIVLGGHLAGSREFSAILEAVMKKEKTAMVEEDQKQRPFFVGAVRRTKGNEAVLGIARDGVGHDADSIVLSRVRAHPGGEWATGESFLLSQRRNANVTLFNLKIQIHLGRLMELDTVSGEKTFCDAAELEAAFSALALQLDDGMEAGDGGTQGGPVPPNGDNAASGGTQHVASGDAGLPSGEWAKGEGGDRMSTRRGKGNEDVDKDKRVERLTKEVAALKAAQKRMVGEQKGALEKMASSYKKEKEAIKQKLSKKLAAQAETIKALGATIRAQKEEMRQKDAKLRELTLWMWPSSSYWCHAWQALPCWVPCKLISRARMHRLQRNQKQCDETVPALQYLPKRRSSTLNFH